MTDNVKIKKNVELLTISEKDDVHYAGYCKVMLNAISKQIFVEPYDDSIKMIQASFDWILVQDENILFAKSPDNTIQFAVIFKNPFTVEKVLNAIEKYHSSKIDNQRVLFIDDILVPAIRESANEKIKEIFLKYVQFCYGKKKGKYLKIIGNNYGAVENNNNKNGRHNSRKRLLHHSDDIPMPAKKRWKIKHQKEQPKKMKCYKFKLIKYKELDEIKEKLFIFVDEKQHFGHSYGWDNEMKKFKCYKCRDKKYISTAALKNDGNGKEYYEVGIHTCHSRKFIKIQNYERRRKLYKPDYKIIEGYMCGKLKQRLIIFDPTNKELCYEYYPKGRKFCCSGCLLSNRKIAAQLFYYGTEKEYVEIFSDEHVCELRPYNPEKFVTEQKIVKKPDYKFEKEISFGKEKERLIIFDTSNKELCYKYAQSCSSYSCMECTNKNHSVTAVLVKNGIDEEEEYIRLSANPHICKPLLYKNIKNGNDKKEIIIESSKFKILKLDKSTVIFVFHEEDKNFGYRYHRSGNNRYYCNGCYEKTHKKENFVNLKTGENGEKYLRMPSAEQKHCCKPVKFEETNNIITAGNFIFAEIAGHQKSKQLIVFTSEDKTFCYNYLYITRNEIFNCKTCLDMGKYSSAKICENLDGKEYVKFGAVKHVCKPKKYSIIKSSITKLLKHNDFPKNQKKDENTKLIKNIAKKANTKILKASNFQLMPNKNGIKDSLLIIPCQNDKTLFYQYNYQKASDNYTCFNCLKATKIAVTAKLCKDINGIEYLTLGKNEHICQPIKKVEKEKCINYLMFDRDDETKPTKLIVFTNDERIECYEYFQAKGRIKFYCIKCIKLKAARFAEIAKDENGTEFIELDEREHLCDPVLFNRVKYEENPTIPASQFLLFPNTNGLPNKKLIIFDPNNYEYGYDCYKGDSYRCYGCDQKGHGFTTKLSTTKNGEKCLEILQNGHICESKNLVKEKRIFYLPNYKTINDESANKVIVLKHPTDKKLCYKFAYDNNFQAFCCIQCRKNKNKITAAKIWKTNADEEIFIIAYIHHCEPIRL